MTDREFFERVRRHAGLQSARDGEAAALAVMTRLAGRLSWREQRDLGAVLPPRLRRAFLSAPNTDLQYAPAAVFLRDVGEALYVPRSQAAEIVRAVGAALTDLLPPDELLDLRAELHDTFETIFAARAAA